MRFHQKQKTASPVSSTPDMGEKALSCYFINDQGHEVRITEQMIQTACNSLKRRCQLPSTAK